MNKQDKANWLDEDGECRMCQNGEWPADALSCPVFDAEVPELSPEELGADMAALDNADQLID